MRMSPGCCAADCEFRDLGGESSVAHSTDTPLTFIDSDFVDNDVPYDDYALVTAWNEDAVVTLENCSFDANTGPNLFYLYSGGTVFATGSSGVTGPLMAVNYDEERNETVKAVAQAPATPARLQPDDPWFVAVREVRLGAPKHLRANQSMAANGQGMACVGVALHSAAQHSAAQLYVHLLTSP